MGRNDETKDQLQTHILSLPPKRRSKVRIIYTNGNRVDTDVSPELLYVLVVAVQKGHAKAQIKARVAGHEFYTDLEGVDVQATFANHVIESYEAA
jgi:hypothetical protein